MRRLTGAVLLGVCLNGTAALARQADAPPQPAAPVAPELKRLTIEELAELDVTSVSRRVERLSQTAAAISVVRPEDIRRLGVLSLPEAMRLADGLDVARTDGRSWSVTARGFNIGTANKLLVLMDGRTLYSPLFAGTFWDVQDTLLYDIDRIEVIRGPGSTVWGANAVNGVINIITKDASETRGNAVMIASGLRNQIITSARNGGRWGPGGSYRVYGKFRRFGENRLASGKRAGDGTDLGQLGVRLDSDRQRPSRWSLQANAYTGQAGAFEADDTTVRGGYAMAGWSRQAAAGRRFDVRGYYDHTYRHVPDQFEESRHTVALDAQQTLLLGGRHHLVAGGELRVTTARDRSSASFFFEPERRTNAVGGVFVQDEIAVGPQLFLTVGFKFEGNDYTGIEVQPTVRARWRRGDLQTFWGAVSRAVRLPTRLDTDLHLIDVSTGAVRLQGSDDFRAESVVAYEAGYRVRPSDRLSMDLAAFVNRYDNLRSQEFPSRLGPVVLLGNTLNAVTSGVEAGANLQVTGRWRVRGAFTSLHKDFSADQGSRDISDGVSEGNDPPYFYTARSYVDLPHGLALDGFFRHVAARPNPDVPAYSSLDVRFGWALRPGWELSLVGQNLLEPRHAEFGQPTPRRHEFERTAYVRSTWYF